MLAWERRRHAGGRGVSWRGDGDVMHAIFLAFISGARLGLGIGVGWGMGVSIAHGLEEPCVLF